MRTDVRTRTARTWTTLLALSLVLAACGNKKDDSAVDGGSVDGGATASSTAPAATDRPPTTESPIPVERGGRIVVAGESEVGNPWQPATIQCDSFCQMRARTFFDPLVVIGEDMSVHGFLAESVEPNADDTVWTIRVRDGVRFHDGTPVDADAVAFNLQTTGGGLLISAAISDIARVDGKLDVRVVDDMTLTIHTGKNGDPSQPLPWPTLPYSLAGQFGLIASPTWLKGVADGTASPTEPVGSGPFIVKSFVPGDRMVVQRNPDYWLKDSTNGQLPYLDEVEFRVIADPDVRLTALQAGDVDLLASSDASAVADARNDPDLVTIMQTEQGDTTHIMFNLGAPGWTQDKSVRCALVEAVDRENVANIVSAGAAPVANGPFSPGQEGYLDDTGILDYDPNAAAAAIAEWENTNGDLRFTLQTLPTPTATAEAELLRQAWEAAGADVDLVQMEQSKVINTVILGGYEVSSWRNYAGVVVDQQHFKWHSSSLRPIGQLSVNFMRLNDPDVDRLLDIARTSTDPDERREAAEDINRRMASECLMLPGTWTQWAVVHDGTIAGLGGLKLPDGSFARDAAGAPGQVWLTSASLATS